MNYQEVFQIPEAELEDLIKLKDIKEDISKWI